MPFEPRGIDGLKVFNIPEEKLKEMQAKAKHMIKKKHVKELLSVMEQVQQAKDQRKALIKHLFSVLRIAIALGFRV